MGSKTLFNAVNFIRPEQVGHFLLCRRRRHFELKVLTGFVPDSDHSMHLKCCALLWILLVIEHF